jgi:hypothetical protein
LSDYFSLAPLLSGVFKCSYIIIKLTQRERSPSYGYLLQGAEECFQYDCCRELRSVFNTMKRSGTLLEVSVVGWSRGEFLTEIFVPAGSELER